MCEIPTFPSCVAPDGAAAAAVAARRLLRELHGAGVGPTQASAGLLEVVIETWRRSLGADATADRLRDSADDIELAQERREREFAERLRASAAKAMAGYAGPTRRERLPR
jgi:hypothetical protein